MVLISLVPQPLVQYVKGMGVAAPAVDARRPVPASMLAARAGRTVAVDTARRAMWDMGRLPISNYELGTHIYPPSVTRTHRLLHPHPPVAPTPGGGPVTGGLCARQPHL